MAGLLTVLAVRALEARGAGTELRGSLSATPTLEKNARTTGREEEEDDSHTHHGMGKHPIPGDVPTAPENNWIVITNRH